MQLYPHLLIEERLRNHVHNWSFTDAPNIRGFIAISVFIMKNTSLYFVTTWSCFRNWLRSRHFSVSFMTRAADYTFCSRGKYQVSEQMVCY